MTLASDFSSLGIVGYNGASFGPSLDSKCIMEAVYDGAARTVSYIVYHFHLEWWLDCSDPGAPNANSPNTTTDSQLETLRVQLMHEGMQFTYATIGLGQINVNPGQGGPAGIPPPSNTNQPQYDVVWGPKPRKFGFDKSLGAKAVKLSFDIDVALANCPQVVAQKKFLELNYTLDWSTQDGYTRRTFRGYLRVPSVRSGGGGGAGGAVNAGGSALGDNADSYLEGVVGALAVPTGFERVTQDRQLSADKCRLDFTVVDALVESTNYPPQSCVRVEASHRMSSPNPKFAAWSGEIEGTYEAIRNVSPGAFWPAFQALVRDRLDALEKAPKTAVIPRYLELAEPSIYKRGKGRFRLTYDVTLNGEQLAQQIQNLLSLSGLWRPAPGSNYGSWAQSMQDGKAWAPRGYAGLVFKNGDDTILNVCNQATKPVTLNAQTTGGGRGGGSNTLKGVSLGLWSKPPDADDSFLDYQLEFFALPRHNVSELKPLPMDAIQYQPKTTAAGDQSGYRPPYNGQNPSTFQFRSNPSFTLVLQGRAVRAGFTITPPQLTTIFGMQPVPEPGAGDYFHTSVVMNLGVPVVRALWRMSFRLPDVPPAGKGILPPLNPLLGGPPGALNLFGGTVTIRAV